MTTVESPLVDRATFRGALSRFASGVTIVTSRDATGRDHGMTVSAFSSLSLTPPLVLVCIDHKATWHAMIDQSTHYVVHVLASDQQALSQRFATDMDDRFADLAVARNAAGVVVLPGAVATLSCRISARHVEGDHTIVVGAVEAVELSDREPLLYHRGAYARLRP